MAIDKHVSGPFEKRAILFIATFLSPFFDPFIINKYILYNQSFGDY